MFNDNDSTFIGATMTATLTTNIEQDFEAPAEAMGARIAANMAGVEITIRRPGGKYKIKGAEVLASDEHGNMEKMDKGKITGSAFITDTGKDHPIWDLIDENTAKFTSILKTYSVPEHRKKKGENEQGKDGPSMGRRGFYLVPMGKTGNLIKELSALANQRTQLAKQLSDDFDTWLHNLRAKFNGQFHLLLPALPSRYSLEDKFAVSWFLSPLTPIDPSSLKFNDINDEDRQQIIEDSNKMARDLINQRARMIYDEAFGSMLEKCEEIASGSMETGKRKFAAITELVESLNRMKNFSEWANPDVIARTDAALEVLTSITDISEVNKNDGQNQVTRAIVAAMKPLGDSVDRMLKAAMPGGSRAKREIVD